MKIVVKIINTYFYRYGYLESFMGCRYEYGSRPGICDIFVHKPIETAHLTIDDADGLRDEVHGIIKKKLERA